MAHPQARLRMPLLFIQVFGRLTVGIKPIMLEVKCPNQKGTFHESYISV
jgi:hypothetical protein